MEMEDGGRREVMVAMEVKNEVKKVKKMKIELREFLRRERKSESGSEIRDVSNEVSWD